MQEFHRSFSLAKEMAIAHSSRLPMIIGAHAAIWIKYHRTLPLGIVTQLYNVASILRLLTFKLRNNIAIHALNTYEY